MSSAPMASRPPMLSKTAMENLRRFQNPGNGIDDVFDDIGKNAIEELVEAGALRSADGGLHRVTTFGSWLLSRPSIAPNTNDNAVYAIVFDDAEKRHHIVIGEAAARAVFAQVSVSWNAHLFGKLASNSRDDVHANDNIEIFSAP